MFVGREQELSELEKLYNREGLKSIAIYGRRRVGKTSLLTEFCKEKKNIFFTGNEVSEKINLQNYSASLQLTFPDTFFGELDSFKDALDITVKICEEERVVLVIDEFPFLVNAAPYFPSLFQKYMDHDFSELDLTVILCGSSIRMMHDLLNGKQMPLFGRFSRQIKLNPLNYIRSCEFFPKVDSIECATYFAISGGVPLYLKWLSQYNTFKESVIENFLLPSSGLLEESTNLIRQEFPNPSIPRSIISALANGKTQIKDISEATGIEKGTCSNSISQLMSVGIIRREVPMSNSRRKAVYELNDGLFRFRYGVLERVLPYIQTYDPESAYEKVEEMLPGFMGKQFEEICKQYVMTNTEYRTVGKWWGSDPEMKTDTEIDIVAIDGIDTTSNVLFGSCKFKSSPMSMKDLDDLKRTASFVKGYAKRNYILFSSSGFEDNLTECAKKEDVALMSIDELYKGRKQ
ncbi:MAG: ATP-binding protein [Bacilli bacterium]